VTSNVRWPAPPYRLSRVLGFRLGTYQAGMWVFGFAGCLLLLCVGWMLFGPDSSFQLNSVNNVMALATFLFAGGGLLWAANGMRRSAPRQAALAQTGSDGRILDVDLLYAEGVYRSGGASRTYFAYSSGGYRYVASTIGVPRPLLLDDLGTRGAALVTPGGAELILANLYPLLLEPGQSALVQADAARLAGRPTITAANSLAALEMQTPPGPARDYVRLYREIGAAPAEARAGLIRQRDKAAKQLSSAALAELLAQCRQQAGSTQGFATAAAFSPSPASTASVVPARRTGHYIGIGAVAMLLLTFAGIDYFLGGGRHPLPKPRHQARISFAPTPAPDPLDAEMKADADRIRREMAEDKKVN
jgi:hypothetical protein